MSSQALIAMTLLSSTLPSAADAPAKTKLAVVPSMLQQYVDWGDLAGAVTLIAQDGKVLDCDAVGYANLATKTPMKKDTLFWVASMTKPMTSAAAMLLVSEGKLALSDPIEKYLPEFKHPWMVSEKTADRMVLVRPSRLVTVRDLLTHTHGLEEPPAIAPGTSLAGAVASTAQGSLQFEPGTQWRYGNAGMNTLGRIVEVISGMPFQDFLRTRFFEPLGMKSTTFYPEPEQLEAMARSYKRPPEWGPLMEVPIGILNGDLRKKEQTVLPGGGLFSTAEDVFRFYQMLANGGELDGRRYLPAALVKEMVTAQTGDLEAGFSAGMAWGLGVGVVKKPQGWTDCLPVGTWGHDGAYGTTVMCEPKTRLLFIMMIQRAGLNPYQDGLKYRHAFHAAVIRAAGG
ncbi:serine hydrolase domain-containing protein [soil metagenome]